MDRPTDRFAYTLRGQHFSGQKKIYKTICNLHQKIFVLYFTLYTLEFKFFILYTKISEISLSLDLDLLPDEQCMKWRQRIEVAI